jgi:hypothetical protein
MTAAMPAIGDTSSSGSGFTQWISDHKNGAIIGGFVIVGGGLYLYLKSRKSSTSTGSTISALPTSGSTNPTTVTLPGGFSFTGSGQNAAGYVNSVLGAAGTTAQYANPTTVTLPGGFSYTGTQSGAAQFLQSTLQQEGSGTVPTNINGGGTNGTSGYTTVAPSDSTTGAAAQVKPTVYSSPSAVQNAAIAAGIPQSDAAAMAAQQATNASYGLATANVTQQQIQASARDYAIQRYINQAMASGQSAQQATAAAAQVYG